MYRTGIFKLTKNKFLALVEPEIGYPIGRTVKTRAEAKKSLIEQVARYAKLGINHPDFDNIKRDKERCKNG